MGIALTRNDVHWLPSILICLATGAVIGLIIGLLVAKLGIPSFVVTLAAFLGLQGVVLVLIGEGGTISFRDPTILAIMNKNLPLWLGWTLCLGGVAAYAAADPARVPEQAGRRAARRPPDPVGDQDRGPGRRS